MFCLFVCLIQQIWLLIQLKWMKMREFVPVLFSVEWLRCALHMKIPQLIFLSQLSDNQAWWPSRNNWISTGIWKVLEKTVTCVRWLHFHVINSVCDELDQTIWLLRKFLCNYVNKTTLKRGTMLLLLKWNKSWQHCQNTHDAAAVWTGNRPLPPSFVLLLKIASHRIKNEMREVHKTKKKEKEKEAGELSLPFDSSIWSLGMNLQIIVTPLAPGIEQKKGQQPSL